MLSSLGCQRNTANQHVFKLFSYHANKHFVGFPILITGQYRITINCICIDVLQGSVADIWYPEPCTRCSCALEEEECVPVQCLSPMCSRVNILLCLQIYKYIHFADLLFTFSTQAEYSSWEPAVSATVLKGFVFSFWLVNVIRSKLDVVFIHGTYMMLF